MGKRVQGRKTKMAPVDLTENKKSLLESLEMKVCAMIGNRRSEQKKYISSGKE